MSSVDALGMLTMDDEMESLDGSIAEFRNAIRSMRRRRLIAWVIRWSLTIVLIVLAFRNYPVAGWILVAFVPLGLWNLYRIFTMTAAANSLLAQMDSMGSRIQTISDAADDIDACHEEAENCPQTSNGKPALPTLSANGPWPKSSPVRRPN